MFLNLINKRQNSEDEKALQMYLGLLDSVGGWILNSLPCSNLMFSTFVFVVFYQRILVFEGAN
jgi:hypothetical protein